MVNTFGLSPDGSVAVLSGLGVAGASPAISVVDTATGRLLADLDAVRKEGDALDVQRRYASDLEFTPDGKTLVVVVRNGAVYFYDTETWEETREPIRGNFQGLDFTSDGTRVMTVNWTDRVVELRDADTFEVLVGPVAASDVSSVGGQSPDILAGNRYAVTGSLADGGATLWDVETLTPIGDPFPHVTDYRDPAVAADANLLGTTTEDGPVIWNIDVESWPDLACRLVGRNLTAAEWEEFGPQDQPYRPTCDQWPALG